jgi:hypothetical protein
MRKTSLKDYVPVWECWGCRRYSTHDEVRVILRYSQDALPSLTAKQCPHCGDHVAVIKLANGEIAMTGETPA